MRRIMKPAPNHLLAAIVTKNGIYPNAVKYSRQQSPQHHVTW